MESLEASVVHTSAWKEDNQFERLDSEYQLKHHRLAIELLKEFGSIQFADDNPEIIHPQEIKREYVEENGVWFLRAQNVRPLNIDLANRVFVSNSDADSLERNEVKIGDVLVNRTGGGQCAIYDRKERAIASSHTFIIRPNQVDSQFLNIFLNSSFGKAQIDKGVYGSLQPEIAPYYLRNIWLPLVSDDLIYGIKKVLDTVSDKMTHSEEKQKLAEHILLDALGLADWSPPEPLSYTATAKDISAAGRLDAQYFMPAKQQVKDSLGKLPGATLSYQVDTIREMFVPSNPATEPIVRNYDLTDALRPLLDTEKQTTVSTEIRSIKKRFRDGDVVISRLGAYLKEIAVVRTNDNIPSVGSSEFIVLRPKEKALSPETIMVFLRSAPVQTILRWCQDGSQRLRFSEKDLLSIPVPDIIVDISEQISDIIHEAFESKRLAQQLLDAAKRAVEVAIEDGEDEALAFLEDVARAPDG